ncbi:hypothetical protein [Hungatella effluvii]|uniref:hypothetical protein n=1 Tax=Hungatella effluvii TaxID=1096246 RepID=UPI0022E58C90|nr:hypothetical protein [Hungatella effluvii]
MRLQKLLSVSLAVLMTMSATPVMTYANMGTTANPSMMENGMDITVSTTSDGKTKASWGKVTMTSSKKKASTKVSTYSGTAYFLAAQTKIPDTGEAVNDDAFNAESVTSGTLYNPNPKEGIRWEGLGIIHDTETSGSQSTTVKKSY